MHLLPFTALPVPQVRRPIAMACGLAGAGVTVDMAFRGVLVSTLLPLLLAGLFCTFTFVMMIGVYMMLDREPRPSTSKQLVLET